MTFVEQVLFFLDVLAAAVILYHCILASAYINSVIFKHKYKHIGTAIGFTLFSAGAWWSIIDWDGGTSDSFLLFGVAIFLTASRRFKNPTTNPMPKATSQ